MASVFSRLSDVLLLFLLLGAALAAATSEQKTTHLHFYFHDLRGGANATSLNVVGLGLASHFGDIGVYDNLLTEGPEMGSKAVGRGQGLVVDTQLDGRALMTTLNFVFTDGEYNGSSLASVGQVQMSLEVNDRAIVGGTGAFRGARGYALSKVTFESEPYLIEEFDLYFEHY